MAKKTKSSEDFPSMTFQSQILTHADFSGQQLSKGDFSYAALRYALFRGSDLLEGIFVEADLQHAIFRGARIKKANFLLLLNKLHYIQQERGIV